MPIPIYTHRKDKPMENKQLSHWTGEFGDQYIDRNPASENNIRARVKTFAEIWRRLQGNPPCSVLECGCNIGLNLRALKQITDAALTGIEPNDKARQRLLDDAVLDKEHVSPGFLGSLPFADSSFELVFTSGVLIHIAPENLDAAMRDIYRVSQKYILAIEYFSKNPETISYRGNTELLWKRDFGKKYLELFPTLQVIDVGFFWSQTTTMDDTTWWLFQKS
jgi:pseudaminic acid biosynthesis-associated methylase